MGMVSKNKVGILKGIRQSLKRIKEPVIRERLLMVQASYKEPLREAVQTFCCVHGKIAYWRRRYDSHGLRGLKTKPRSGRPSKMSKAKAMKIKRKVRKHNVTRGWQTKMIKDVMK